MFVFVYPLFLMKIVYSDEYFADIGFHVFPLQKYHLIKETLLQDKVITENDIIAPVFPDFNELKIVHSDIYVDDLMHARPTNRLLRSEMPISKDIINAQTLSAAGTHLAARTAIEGRTVCFHDGGGFHHAFADHAEGFCYVNDIAYGAKKVLQEKLVKKVVVIDCDLHQGNGTARIFQNDPQVFTFSIHQENLYPVKEISNLDIGLDNGIGDEDYLNLLNQGLVKIFKEFKPEFVICLAGADPYLYDQLGNLALTIDGLKKRDALVLNRCYEEKVPVAIVLGGGYATKVNDTVTIHANTARVAKDIFDRSPGAARRP